MRVEKMPGSQESKKERALELHKEACQAEKQGNLDTANKLLDQAIALCPKASIFWTTKSLFQYDCGRYEDAKTLAKKALEINSKNYYGWLLLAGISHDLRDFQESANYYKEYVKLKESDWAFTILATLEADFDPESALRHATRALELNPNWTEARELIKQIRAKVADKAD